MTQGALHDRLRARFAEEFGGAATRRSRAPGRVNLIGEHTDYNGLPVLPMALDREVVIAFRPRPDGRVVLANLDPRFPIVQFELGADIPPEGAGTWGNYVRAAGQALWRELGVLTGFDGVIGSTVPVAAGLSSSSALVVATAMALLDASGCSVERRHLSGLLAAGERYVGLQGGGMDQTISLGGQAHHALRIDFKPVLALTPVPMPDDWQVVVASSMVEAAKATGAMTYNTRVRECREALSAFADAVLGGETPADYADLGRRIAPREALAKADKVLEGTLLRRFRHVVSEGQRVDLAQAAMERGDLETFGQLLRQSHASLRDDYEVSCAELDELVALAEAGGAAGARLTGAGFGGCIVAVAHRDRADQVLAALERGFYGPRGVRDAPGTYLFAAVPAAGASVGEMDLPPHS